MTVGIFGFSISTELWMFYAFAPLLGFGSTTFYSIASPTLIQNWFAKKHRGKFLGIAAAFTGIGTFVWAPLFTVILQNMGWRSAYMINALFILALTLWFAIVVKRTPQEKGLKPFGYVEGEEEAEAKSANEAGATRKTALKSVAFWLLMVGAIGCCLGAGFNNNQPGIAIEKLAPLMDAKAAGLVGAGMISTAAVGNLLGKIAFGAISDRLGVRPTSAIFIAMLAAAFLLWIFSGSTEMLLVGAFLFGTHNALISVAFPLIVRQLYGGKNFSSIWSLWSMPFTLLGGFSTSIIGFIYAGTGNSYTTSLWIGLIGVAVVAVCVMIACQFIGKIAWDDKPEGKVAENA